MNCLGSLYCISCYGWVYLYTSHGVLIEARSCIICHKLVCHNNNCYIDQICSRCRNPKTRLTKKNIQKNVVKKEVIIPNFHTSGMIQLDSE
jgi:hypothetical protein